MNSQPDILLGTHYHPGGPEALRRQERARNSLLQLNGVRLVNLQFPDARIEAAGFETVPELRNDSQKATGRTGVRKPIGSEAFQRLAGKAREYGLPYFAWANSDITVTQAAVDYVAQSGLEGCVLSRMDFSGDDGQDRGMFVGGQDCFVFGTDWWFKNRDRFRPYVNSEAYWDNIYTTITLCHARSVLINRQGLIRHETHARVWSASPFADYNRYLASLDSLYLFLWQNYKARLYEMRNRNASEAEEMELQRTAFNWNPSLPARIWQVGRGVKARLRHHVFPGHRPLKS